MIGPTFKEVERMFQDFDEWQTRLSLLQPRVAVQMGFVSIDADGNPSRSAVEHLAIERAELSKKIEAVRGCLKLMTKDERRFIELRYFQNLPMRSVKYEMYWSRRQLYRLRASCLAKAAWLLGLLVPA